MASSSSSAAAALSRLLSLPPGPRILPLPQYRPRLQQEPELHLTPQVVVGVSLFQVKQFSESWKAKSQDIRDHFPHCERGYFVHENAMQDLDTVLWGAVVRETDFRWVDGEGLCLGIRSLPPRDDVGLGQGVGFIRRPGLGRERSDLGGQSRLVELSQGGLGADGGVLRPGTVANRDESRLTWLRCPQRADLEGSWATQPQELPQCHLTQEVGDVDNIKSLLMAVFYELPFMWGTRYTSNAYRTARVTPGGLRRRKLVVELQERLRREWEIKAMEKGKGKERERNEISVGGEARSSGAEAGAESSSQRAAEMSLIPPSVPSTSQRSREGDKAHRSKQAKPHASTSENGKQNPKPDMAGKQARVGKSKAKDSIAIYSRRPPGLQERNLAARTTSLAAANNDNERRKPLRLQTPTNFTHDDSEPLSPQSSISSGPEDPADDNYDYDMRRTQAPSMTPSRMRYPTISDEERDQIAQMESYGNQGIGTVNDDGIAVVINTKISERESHQQPIRHEKHLVQNFSRLEQHSRKRKRMTSVEEERYLEFEYSDSDTSSSDVLSTVEFNLASRKRRTCPPPPEPEPDWDLTFDGCMPLSSAESPEPKPRQRKGAKQPLTPDMSTNDSGDVFNFPTSPRSESVTPGPFPFSGPPSPPLTDSSKDDTENEDYKEADGNDEDESSSCGQDALAGDLSIHIGSRIPPVIAEGSPCSQTLPDFSANDSSNRNMTGESTKQRSEQRARPPTSGSSKKTVLGNPRLRQATDIAYGRPTLHRDPLNPPITPSKLVHPINKMIRTIEHISRLFNTSSGELSV